jgi:hypothetical protein
MIVFVHQPEYIPWLGFFDKLARCDTYVIYDDAQFQHGSFHNRNRVRSQQGWDWLTVPITHGYPQTIKDVRICGDRWKAKQINNIKNNYKKSPYFERYYQVIEDAITTYHERLISLNLQLIRAIAKVLDIKVKMICSSEFPHDGQEKNEKLVSMCKVLGAKTYLCGSGGQNYIQENRFNEANVSVLWHDYEHPRYRQMFGDFEPNMSIIDLLFNEGPNAKEILLRGGILREKKAEEAEMVNPLMIQK